jgi:hypothetical protein
MEWQLTPRNNFGLLAAANCYPKCGLPTVVISESRFCSGLSTPKPHQPHGRDGQFADNRDKLTPKRVAIVYWALLVAAATFGP